MKWKDPELLPLSSRAHGDFGCSPTGSSAGEGCSTGIAAADCHNGRSAVANCSGTGSNFES